MQLNRGGRRAVEQRRQQTPPHREDRLASEKLLSDSVWPERSQEAGCGLEKRQRIGRSQGVGPCLEGEPFADF